jgi:hypothetical protein
MKLNTSAKEAIIIVVFSLILFVAFRGVINGEEKLQLLPSRKRQPLDKPVLSPDEMQDNNIRPAYLALCAYIDAYNNNETESTLRDLREAFQKDLSIIIYEDENNKLAVKSVDGKDILKYDAPAK